MFLKGITGQRDVDRTFKEPKRGRKERKKASDISFCNWLECFDFFVASGFQHKAGHPVDTQTLN